MIPDSELDAMDLEGRVAEVATRIESRLGMMSSEEATKHGLVMPVLKHVFRYNPFDPNDVVPEFVCDVGTKRGERVDYALMRGGIPVLLIECKAHGAALSDAHTNQLFRYFTTSVCKFAALTNGTEWWFYSDTDEVNKMDAEPFFAFDFRKYDAEDIEALRVFVKGEAIGVGGVERGWRLMMRRKMRDVVAKEVASPSDDVVKVFTRKVYDKRLTPARGSTFKELVADAFKGTYIEDDP